MRLAFFFLATTTVLIFVNARTQVATFDSVNTTIAYSSIFAFTNNGYFRANVSIQPTELISCFRFRFCDVFDVVGRDAFGRLFARVNERENAEAVCDDTDDDSSNCAVFNLNGKEFRYAPTPNRSSFIMSSLILCQDCMNQMLTDINSSSSDEKDANSNSSDEKDVTGTKSEEKDIIDSKFEEEDVTKSDEEDVIKSEEKDATKSEEKDVTRSKGKDVTKAKKKDVTRSKKKDGTRSKKKDGSNSKKRDGTKSKKKDGTRSKKKDGTRSKKKDGTSSKKKDRTRSKKKDRTKSKKKDDTRNIQFMAGTVSIPTQGSYSIDMQNAKSRYSHLGWDEMEYPAAAAVFTTFAIILLLLLGYGFGTVYWFKFIAPPFPAKIVIVITLLKIITYSLYCAAYWSVGQERWFPYAVLPFDTINTLLIGFLILFMCTGTGLIPATWKIDRTSSRVGICIGFAIVLFDIVLGRIWDVVRYYIFVVFHVAFLGICVLHCRRNARFFDKYKDLVEEAKIKVETTPLRRVVRFFWVNACVLIVLFLVQVVAWNLVRVRRADVRWVVGEVRDLMLLGWYTFCLFPRQGSAYYLDMSVVNNERLKQVNLWRWSLEQHASENELMSSGGTTLPTRRVNRSEDGPQYPTIDWVSGDPLPVPNTSVWSLQQEMERRRAFARIESETTEGRR